MIVVGDPPDDWGEDGRIVWMLRAAGHPRVALVDGGIDALARAGASFTMKRTAPTPGRFVVRPVSSLSTSASTLQSDGAIVLDTRELREFDGATPYGESRGGHVPGAKHLYFEDLMNPDGTVLADVEIAARLEKLGASRSTKLVTYCTGGVRSAWVLVVLKNAGFKSVRNYPGSMWEWSSSNPAAHPLETD